MSTETAQPELPKASELLETVRNEAAELRNFTITFLSLLLYVSLIVAATDHEQILRISPVVLPLLNVSIPILGFYWFMSPFLFFMHLYILVQHYLFSQLAFRFAAALRQESPALQNNIRRRLGNLPFLHWLLGRHGPVMQTVMTLITVVALIIWPLFMFWWLQARFLPYHDADLVLWQQCWLTADVVLLAYLWAKIMDERDSPWHWWKQTKALWLSSKYLFQKEWRFTKARLACWQTAWINDAATPYWLRYLQIFTTWWPSGTHFLATVPQRCIVIARSVGLMISGVSRLLFISLLFTALGLSWVVSLVPDSPQEQRIISALLWLESLRSDDSNPADKYEWNYGDWQQKHWLLVNLKSKLNPKDKRLVFSITAWLHEKKPIVTSDPEIQQHSPGRILEATCQDYKTTERMRCYLVDSLLPRNLILREMVITADADLKPELANTLLPEKARPTNETLKIDEAVLKQIKPINLQGRNFDYANFTGSSLPKADLRSANLKHANLTDVRMENTNLESVHLEKSFISNTSFAGALLKQADFKDAVMSGNNFTRADLSQAYLAGANLSYSHFENAILKEAKLPKADLTGAHLENTDLTKAFMPYAELFRSQLTGANLSEAILRGAALVEANLVSANLLHTNLGGVNFSGANLTGANLIGSYSGGANFYGASLVGANLNFADLAGANLSHADLAGADLSEAHLAGADLSKANLIGAILKNTRLAGTIMTSITYEGLSDKVASERLEALNKSIQGNTNFHTTIGQQKLNTFETELKTRLKQTADFSHTMLIDRNNDEITCLSELPILTQNNHPCMNWLTANNQQKDIIYQYWKKLACDIVFDYNEKWLPVALAKPIVDRGIISRLDENYWLGFADILIEALQDAKQCPGLAGIPDNLKQELRETPHIEKELKEYEQKLKKQNSEGKPSSP